MRTSGMDKDWSTSFEEDCKVLTYASYLLMGIIVVLGVLYFVIYTKLPNAVSFSNYVENNTLYLKYDGPYQIGMNLTAQSFLVKLMQTMQTQLESYKQQFVVFYVGNFPITYVRILVGIIVGMLCLLFPMVVYRSSQKDTQRLTIYILRGIMTTYVAIIFFIIVISTSMRMESFKIVSQFDSLSIQQEKYFYTYTHKNDTQLEYLIVTNEQLAQQNVHEIPEVISIFDKTYVYVEETLPVKYGETQNYCYLKLS